MSTTGSPSFPKPEKHIPESDTTENKTEEQVPILESESIYSNAQEIINTAEETTSHQELTPTEIPIMAEDTTINNPTTAEPATTSSAIVSDNFQSNYFSSRAERKIFIWFIIAPAIISFVSALHLVEFFGIGNHPVLAFILGIAFEMGTIASIVGIISLQGLGKSTRFFLWVTIMFLFFLQILGNVYSAYAYIDTEVSPKIFELLGLDITELASKRIVAYILGATLPVVAFSLVKIASNYLARTKK